MADDRSGPLLARRTVAARLRSLRQAAGFGQTQLSEATGISQGKISKVERGEQPIRLDQAELWIRACGASEDQVRGLLDLAEAALSETSTWRAEHRYGLTAKQHRVADLQDRTKRLREFNPAVVPGLVQTYDYARTILGMVDVSDQQDVETAAQARVERQSILDDPHKTVQLIVTHSALLWQMDDAQRAHLVHMARRGDGSLGVLPASPAAGLPPFVNPFVIYEFTGGGDPLVVVETYLGEMYHDDPRDVNTYSEIFESFAAAALFGAQAEAELSRIL